MAKYSVIDPRWLGDAIGGLVFLVATGVVLYVWATSMRPVPNRLMSAIVYYVILVALVGAVVAICAKGFTYRWTEVGNEGLVLHEGFYGLVWKTRVVPKSEIITVERYDYSRVGMFTHVPSSGLRVCLMDGSALVLAESDGEGKYHQECAEMRRALGIPRDG
jgi:hypothetical protein